MLGDSITVSLGGAGGTPVVLSKINQDNYTSEYLNKGASFETRMTIRHAKDNVKAGAQPFDRHTVVLEKFEYPSEVKPQGVRYQTILTLRTDPTGQATVSTDLGEALVHWATDVNLTKLFGWES